MATTDEIRRRVQDVDTARSARRADAAQQLGELAHHRRTIVNQLEDVERQLGNVIAAAHEVIDLDELARFTDVSTADLTRWLEARTNTRSKRRKPSAGASDGKAHSRRTAAAEPEPAPVHAPASAEPVARRDDTPAHAIAR